jgi:hypothetical protein
MDFVDRARCVPRVNRSKPARVDAADDVDGLSSSTNVCTDVMGTKQTRAAAFPLRNANAAHYLAHGATSPGRSSDADRPRNARDLLFKSALLHTRPHGDSPPDERRCTADSGRSSKLFATGNADVADQERAAIQSWMANVESRFVVKPPSGPPTEKRSAPAATSDRYSQIGEDR